MTPERLKDLERIADDVPTDDILREAVRALSKAIQERDEARSELELLREQLDEATIYLAAAAKARDEARAELARYKDAEYARTREQCEAIVNRVLDQARAERDEPE